MRQAIIWTNDGKFTDAYICHSASMSWDIPKMHISAKTCFFYCWFFLPPSWSLIILVGKFTHTHKNRIRWINPWVFEFSMCGRICVPLVSNVHTAWFCSMPHCPSTWMSWTTTRKTKRVIKKKKKKKSFQRQGQQRRSDLVSWHGVWDIGFVLTHIGPWEICA